MREVIKTAGFRELVDALKRLPEAVHAKVLVRALRAGAKPVEATAKRMAPVLKSPDPRRRPGTLRRAISTARMRDNSLDSHGAAVKVRVKRLSGKAVSAFKEKTGKHSSDNPDDPFYAHVLEYGKLPRTAHPFLRPALYAEREAAIQEMAREMRAGIDREARKLAKKAR